MTAHLILAAIMAMTPDQSVDTAREAGSQGPPLLPAADFVVSRSEGKSQASNLDQNAAKLHPRRAAAPAGNSVGSNGTTSGRVTNDGKTNLGQSVSGVPAAGAATPSICTQRNEYDPADFTRVLENFDRTTSLRLDGPQWNNTLVRNCRVHDTGAVGILVRHVRNVVIHNCEVWNVDVGIQAGPTGGTEDVTIDGNHVHDTQRTGIGASQRSADGVHQKNMRILNNRVENTGLGFTDGHAHPIYVQSQDFLIQGNVISGSRDGNGISVRSSGVVRCNSVSGVSSAEKPALRYYSDHQTGPSNTLLIEHNQLISDRMGVELKSPTDQRRGSRAVRLLHRAWIRVRVAINRAFGAIGFDVPFPHRNRHVVKNFVIRHNSITAPEPISIAPEYDTSPYRATVHDNRFLIPSPEGAIRESRR